MTLANLKEGEHKGYGFDQIEENSMLSRPAGHKVIPSREEVSRRILEGGVKSKLIEPTLP